MIKKILVVYNVMNRYNLYFFTTIYYSPIKTCFAQATAQFLALIR